MKQYQIAYVDPPWYYPTGPTTITKEGKTTRSFGAGDYYQLMKEEEIVEYGTNVTCSLSADGVVFLWATLPLLDQAFRVIEGWGLEYAGMPFVWVKTKKDGSPMGAKGGIPRIVKPTCEVVLAASKQHQIIRPSDFTIRNVVMEPPREHSRKPDCIRDAIERMYPNANKVEHFSRQTFDGWDCFGNEVGKFDSCRYSHPHLQSRGSLLSDT